MKFATLKNGQRDGVLVLVSRDLSKALPVPNIASTLQQLIDNWQLLSPQLESLYALLNEGKAEGAMAFSSDQCMAPLPRAYQWADGSAYVNHVELVRKARGAVMPESFWTAPLMYQGGSDRFIGPTDPIQVIDEQWGIDFEAEVAVITDDVPMGVTSTAAAKHIKLLMLVNDVSLRNLIPGELAKGFGFFQAKPASSFSPVAVTPDELGSRWDGKRLAGAMCVWLNEKPFGRPDCGVDMTFDFPTLIAHAAKTRELGAGTIVGSGTISNYDRSSGSCCLAEKRMLEVIETGEARTSFMKFGDRVKIAMYGENDNSIFGDIEQAVQAYALEE